MTKSSLSHVQLKNGIVVGHVTRNMSSKLQFFIKYEGLLEMKVVRDSFEGFKPIVYHLNKKKLKFPGFRKNRGI